jgi:hypothetical protein
LHILWLLSVERSTQLQQQRALAEAALALHMVVLALHVCVDHSTFQAALEGVCKTWRQLSMQSTTMTFT